MSESKEEISIQWALNIRKLLKSNEILSHGERYAIRGILIGDYDRYKDDAVTIANEDMEFLNEEQRKQLEKGE